MKAIASVLRGRTAPTGRLPVSVPRHPGSQPSTHLAARLGHSSEVSSVDPTPAFGFGHGLTYTAFEWSDLLVEHGRASTVREFTGGATTREGPYLPGGGSG